MFAIDGSLSSIGSSSSLVYSPLSAVILLRCKKMAAGSGLGTWFYCIAHVSAHAHLATKARASDGLERAFSTAIRELCNRQRVSSVLQGQVSSFRILAS